MRGTGIAQIDRLYLQVPAQYSATRQAFTESLIASGVDVVSLDSDASSDVHQVAVNDERSFRRPISTSAAIDAAEYELLVEIDISVSKAGDLLLDNATLSSSRVYSVDTINLSASYEEQNLLLGEIRTEIARHMIRRVEAIAISVAVP